MIKIRKAIKDDLDVIYDLIIGIAKHHNQEQYVLTDKQELLKAGFDKNPKYGVLIAEFEGQVAGYLSYTWNYSIWTGCDYMNIDDLFVWSKFRRQKSGKYLMEFAKDICKEKGIRLLRWEVEKDNLKAIDFYKRLGAKLTEKGIFRWELYS
ncbi:GNAT family N-acetyltransferase [uncultured Croceitalea sp.]|uniref:GNAT family N-acetyltransferase n=1 Tax=uncultured Croceitalea sp. TaxID=1798908 RepID=UPI003306801F